MAPSRQAAGPPVGQGGAQKARFVDRQAGAEALFAADVERSGDGVKGVGIHQPADGYALVVDCTEVEGSGIGQPEAQESARGDGDEMLVAHRLTEVHRRVPQGVGPLRQHHPPRLRYRSAASASLIPTRSMWLWMMAAPASRQASASAAISSGVRGTFGFRSLVVAPLIAASMITGSEAMLRHRRPTSSATSK